MEIQRSSKCSSLGKTKRAENDSLLGGIASAVSSRYFRDDDYIDDKDGFRHCAKCKGAKEMIVQFENTDLPDMLVPCACPCLEAEDKANEAIYEEQRRQEAIERVRSIGLRSNQLRESRFDMDDSTDSKTSRAIRAYTETWEDMKKNNYGLLLEGQVGTGKTFYAGCIANELIDKGERAYFITAPEIVAIASDFSDVGRDRRYELEQKALYWDLLIIDDLGAQRNTEFGSEAVFNVINARYETGKPTIVTTNLRSDELDNSESLDEKRIVDRIREMCPVRVPVAGKSRRQQVRKDRFSDATQILERAMKREKP